MAILQGTTPCWCRALAFGFAHSNSEDSLTMTCCLLLVLRYLVYLLQVKSKVLFRKK